MVLAFANAATKSAQFDVAYARTLKERQALQSLLKPIGVAGRFNTLGFVIGDYPLNFFKVNREADDTIYQVFVGYDLSSAYTRDEDEKIVQMIGMWTRRVFQETAGFETKRLQLLELVNRWEDEVTRRIVRPLGPTGVD